MKAVNSGTRGTHSREHLSGLIADHYKQEDIDLHLWKMSDP